MPKPKPAIEPSFDLEAFPTVPEEHRPRRIVFDCLPEQEVKMLTKRGYRPTLLRTMPRETARDNIDFLLALLQGVTDGTVVLPKARGEAVFMEMKARGLFTERGVITVVPTELDADVKNVLAWEDSRHTLYNNTTITDPKRLEELAAAALGVRGKKD